MSKFEIPEEMRNQQFDISYYPNVENPFRITLGGDIPLRGKGTTIPEAYQRASGIKPKKRELFVVDRSEPDGQMIFTSREDALKFSPNPTRFVQED